MSIINILIHKLEIVIILPDSDNELLTRERTIKEYLFERVFTKKDLKRRMRCVKYIIQLISLHARVY